MNEQMPFDRLVAGWMDDHATGAPEPLLDQILTTTGRMRPQPRWWALLAEAPMRRERTRVGVGLSNRGLVFAALIALVLAGLAAAAIGVSILLDRPAPPDAADWPGFRGSADRAGIGLQGPTGDPVLGWRFKATGAVMDVAILGDRAYFASDDGRVYGVSRDRGTLLWSTEVPNPPLSGPFAADGQLYLTDSTGIVHALAQADGTTGWTSTTAYPGPSRIVSVDGTVYFGTTDGFVVALDSVTGTERWRLQPPGATLVDAPAFGSGLLFAGTDGAGYVAIDPATQQVVWQGDTHGENTGTATVADGIAYIGAAAEATSGRLRAFEAKTGRLLWTAEDDLLQAPAVAEGVAYSSTNQGLVVGIDTATGATTWRLDLNGQVRAPVVAGGVVYLDAGSERRVYAVDAATGDRLWQFDTGANGNCCLAVARGAVYLGLQDGSVYSIGGDGASIVPQPFPSHVAAASATPEPSAGAALPSIGTVTWSTDIGGMGFAPINQIAVDPTGRIWAPEAESGRIAIFGADGKRLETWGEPGSGEGQFDFTRSNGDGYGTLAFATDGSFYVLDVGNRRVQRFDAKRRFVGEWGEFGSAPGQYNDPVGIAVAPDGSVWVLDDSRRVVEHYDATGKVLGSFDPFASLVSTDGANSMTIDAQGRIYISSVAPSEVLVFDATGTLLDTIGQGDFAEQATDMAIDAAGRLFVTQGPERGDAPGVLAFGPDGSLIGGFGPTGSGDGELVFPAGIALDGQGGLIVEDSDSGSARLMRVQLLAPFGS